MRTRRIIAATVAAGVVGAGVVATPMVLAADNDDNDAVSDDTSMPYGPRWADEDGDDTGRPWGMQDRRESWGKGQPAPGEGLGMQRGRGQGMGMGPGGGQHMGRDGDCLLDQDGTASGTLDEADEQALLEQVEHEKVSRDVYAAFFEQTGDYRFERVGQSEQHHLDALRMLLDRYDLADPTEGLEEGEFQTAAFQDQYEAYVEQGDDLEGALAAAREIEKDDIADLKASAKALDDAPDVERVYEQQVVASQRHLEVFSR